MEGYEFFVDPSRCIGCRACVAACAECDTHRGTSMIHVDFLDRASGIQTTPMVCMHCDDPTCAQVCFVVVFLLFVVGVVLLVLLLWCVACNNCVLACPFGIPKMQSKLELMMKCDMCWDRTSVGKRPMCATVCPSQALAYVTPERIAKERREKPTNVFQFGRQTVTTKVFMMVPPAMSAVEMDVVDYMRVEA